MTYISKDDYKIKDDLLWWHERGLSYTATGYGNKIPTTKKLHFKGRWHRIYCRIYSNMGTEYIIHNKQKVILL